MPRDDDELAALTDEFERTDPRLADSLTRFRPARRPLMWAVAVVLAVGVPTAGWLIDPRIDGAITIALILCSPLVAALAMSRSVPPGGATR